MRNWRRDWKRWKAIRDYPLIVGVSALSEFHGHIKGGSLHPSPGSVVRGLYLDGTNLGPRGYALVVPVNEEDE